MGKYWEGWKNSAAIYWRGGGDRFRGMLGKHSNLHFKTGHSHFIEIFACLSFPVFLRNILRGIFLNIYHTSGGRHNKARIRRLLWLQLPLHTRDFWKVLLDCTLGGFSLLYILRYFHTSVLLNKLLACLGTWVPPVGSTWVLLVRGAVFPEHSSALCHHPRQL